MPYSNWFIDQLFTKNGQLTDTITVGDLSNIMSEMGIQPKWAVSRSLLIKNSLQYLLFEQSANTRSLKRVNTTSDNTTSIYNMNYTQV